MAKDAELCEIVKKSARKYKRFCNVLQNYESSGIRGTLGTQFVSPVFSRPPPAQRALEQYYLEISYLTTRRYTNLRLPLPLRRSGCNIFVINTVTHNTKHLSHCIRHCIISLVNHSHYVLSAILANEITTIYMTHHLFY